ncbi:Spy/CpxP family protein refolding chaperone [Pelagibacterium sp.]|uniref:Spy/CpxP family protein refolding chaperone n=1 Tax=Pelagibacterium sp. TaxID=1967288 RepID=UPI003A8FAB51
MKPLTKKTIAAIAATSIGATALTPALAQPFAGIRDNGTVQEIQGDQARSFRPGGSGPLNNVHQATGLGKSNRLAAIFLSERGAEAIDITAVRLTHLLELHDDQKLLLEDLQTAALNAHSVLQTARNVITPIEDQNANKPDIIAGFAGMVAMITARAEALESVQPAFEAFVESLDDSQLDKLASQRHGGPRSGAIELNVETTSQIPVPRG